MKFSLHLIFIPEFPEFSVTCITFDRCTEIQQALIQVKDITADYSFHVCYARVSLHCPPPRWFDSARTCYERETLEIKMIKNGRKLEIN